MTGRVNAILAIVVSALPLPTMMLLDYFNRNCGDGLCGFFSGLLILGALAAATLFFLVASARQKETPTFLRWLPLPLWLFVFIRIFI
jgi:hypothetical protein